jgi:hypothetical protein
MLIVSFQQGRNRDYEALVPCRYRLDHPLSLLPPPQIDATDQQPETLRVGRWIENFISPLDKIIFPTIINTMSFRSWTSFTFRYSLLLYTACLRGSNRSNLLTIAWNPPFLGSQVRSAEWNWQGYERTRFEIGRDRWLVHDDFQGKGLGHKLVEMLILSI